MEWEIVMGLEVHTELATKTKIFCGCSTEFGGEPNTHVCEICSGMPGTLPLLNKRVVEFAVRTGIATNCTITQNNKFDRKNYFYPDLPKAYQISQLYLPICRNGFIEVKDKDGNSKKIGIHEIHMEEDAGKLVHDEFEDCTLVDYNRCGVPLLEIVSEPDFRSAEEVLSYLTELRSILQYIGVSDCKMQEGSLRCDVNLSVRPAGSEELGTRTEMKNLNSFKAITRAIADQGRTIRIPVHLVESINRVKKTAGELLRRTGREPTAEEIAAQLDMEPARVRELIQLAQDPISLETPVGEEEDAHLEDFIRDDEAGVPADEAGRQLLRRELMNVLKSLTPREERVIALRFGLEDGRARTLEELGREFNVTRERVRQIEAKALRKLRHPSRAKRLRDYLDE